MEWPWDRTERELLKALRGGAHLLAACDIAQVSRKAVYRRMSKDVAFRERVEAAAKRTVRCGG
jgi:hypothetical protein